MRTRWHRHEYEAEYEKNAHPERSDPKVQDWEVSEGGEDYEPNPTTGYDPTFDHDMRFQAQGWDELVEHADERPDPTAVLDRDSLVRAVVSERLTVEPGVDLTKIGLYCEAGVVALRGTVGSHELKKKLVRIVARLPEVAGVIDELQVAQRH